MGNIGRGILEKVEEPSEFLRQIIKYTIDFIGNIKPEDAPRYATDESFRETGVEQLIWTFYDRNRLKAICDIYPDIKLPGEFDRVPINFWVGREGWLNALYALEWFADIMGIKTEEDCGKVTCQDFQEKGLAFANIL